VSLVGAPGPPRSAEFEVVSGLNWELVRRTVFELTTVCGSNCPAPSWSRTVDSRNVEPRDAGAALLFRLQIDITSHAAVVHLVHGQLVVANHRVLKSVMACSRVVEYPRL
jgi:hypothetical protein